MTRRPQVYLRPLLPNDTYTAAEVAALVLKHPAEWFYRYRIRLIHEEGFPKPISKIGQPRWSGAALLAWLASPRDETGKCDMSNSNVLDLRTEIARREAALRVLRRLERR